MKGILKSLYLGSTLQMLNSDGIFVLIHGYLMKGVFISSCLILASLNLFAQSESADRNKLIYSVFGAGGRSIFQSDVEGPSKFPTAEVRLGGSVTFKVGKQFDILTRMDFGAKIKREMINQPGQPYTVTGPWIELDRMAARTHYFLEIPVMLQYRLLHPKLNVAVGINYRKFFNQDYEELGVIDTFSGRNEIGTIGRIAYRAHPKFTIGVEYCIALTQIYSVVGIYDGEEYKMKTRNQFGQVTLEYNLKFWKQK